MKLRLNADGLARISCLGILCLVSGILGAEALAGGFGDDGPLPVWVSEKLPYQSPAGARAFLDSQFEHSIRMFEDLEKTKQVDFQNCRALLAGEKKYLYSFDNFEYLYYRQQPSECRIAHAVEQQQPAKISFLETTLFGKNNFDLVPAFLAVAVRRCDENMFAYLANAVRAPYQPQNRHALPNYTFYRVGQYDFSFSTEFAANEFSVLARGDFNDDGIEDFLVSSHSYVPGGTGTYKAWDSFLLTRYWQSGPYTVLNPERYLFGCKDWSEREINEFEHWYTGSK